MQYLIFSALTLVTIFSMDLKAEDSGYFKDHEQGYWWYQKVSVPEKKEDKFNKADEKMTSKQMLESQGKEWEDAFANAVVSPNDKNVKRYLYLTNKINEQAEKFAVAFKENIWVNPDLDYTLKRPVITDAIIAQNEKDSIKQEIEIHKIAKKHGLIFFFKGSCPHCHKFSPILKNFANKFQFSIIPVTLDGGSLPDFSNPKKNYLLGTKLNVSTVPALYMLNPDTNSIAPISYGYTDWTTLAQKIIVAGKKMGEK